MLPRRFEFGPKGATVSTLYEWRVTTGLRLLLPVGVKSWAGRPSMPDDRNDAKFSRRGFLEISSGTLAAAGTNSVAKFLGPDPASAAQDNDRSTSDPGPGNPESLRGESSADRRRQRANLQIPIRLRAQAASRRRLVARSNGAGTGSLQDDGRRQHAPHGRRHSRAPLAHRRRMGLHAHRQRAHHRRRRRWQEFRCRREGKRPVVFPHRNSPLDSGTESRWRGISTRFRRRYFFGVSDLAAVRLEGAHAEGV